MRLLDASTRKLTRRQSACSLTSTVNVLTRTPPHATANLLRAGGPLYYVLALTPFAVWLAVAVVRPSRRPFRDFLVLGVLYGLSLVLVHQLFWNAAASLGHRPPGIAVDFADRFRPELHEAALRGYTIMIATGYTQCELAGTVQTPPGVDNDLTGTRCTAAPARDSPGLCSGRRPRTSPKSRRGQSQGPSNVSSQPF